MDCKHYIIATLPIPKYCIFIFTLRCVVISYVISSTAGGVPDRNFSLPFFSCMTYKKRMPLKSQTHLHRPLVVLFPLLGMFSPRRTSASPVNIISVPSAQSHESIPFSKIQFKYHFPQPFQEEFITLAQCTTTRYLFMLPDYSCR